jgi:SNF2 family DNA or RNA helicase
MVELERDPRYTAMMLVDDMGLGKTTTSISVCISNPHWPTLIFSPNGLLVYNWQDEIKATVKGNTKILGFASVPDFTKLQNAVEWATYHFISLTYEFLVSDKWMEQVLLLLTMTMFVDIHFNSVKAYNGAESSLMSCIL